MKIPVEWLNEYIDLNLPSKELAESFTSLGLMLDKPIIKYSSGEYETDVLDLEHRMDRSDWLSVLGCARDISAFYGKNVKYPKLYLEKGKTPDASQIVDIKVDCPDLVRRFNTRTFKNIKVGESPAWLKNRLESYGIGSINNIVDITNYVMVETGQPMHAQDLAKFSKREILIRRANKSERLVTLLGEELVLDEEYFVLTQNGQAIVLGGIVGGKATAVDGNTSEILLDAGNYNQINIRRSSRRCKIQNETVLRYDKYLNPKLTELAIARATQLILDMAGGEYYENVDWYPNKAVEEEMNVRFSRIEKLAGFNIERSKVESILQNLEYQLIGGNEKELQLVVPYFRTDVEVEDDIVADILRMSNFNTIPIGFVGTTPPSEITPKIYKFEEKLADICVAAGLHEHITDPLVEGNPNDEHQVLLENAGSPEKQGLRRNLYKGLLKVSEIYFKHKISEAQLFEIGKIYEKINSGDKYADYSETRVLQVVIKNTENNPIETANKTKVVLSTILKNLGINTYQVDFATDKRLIRLGNEILGEIGYDSFFLYTEPLMGLSAVANRIVTDYSQIKTEDISVIMPRSQPVGPIYNRILEIDKNITEVECKVEELDDVVGKENKSVLFKVSFTGNTFADSKEKIKALLKESYKVKIRD